MPSRGAPGRDLFVFHLGYPDLSARYNAIGNFSRVTEVATRIANQLPSEGNSAAFKEFAWRFVNIIARALVDLGRRPDYAQVRRHINDIEPLFIEYARHVLVREDIVDWAARIGGIESNLNERNLPHVNLKGRGMHAIAVFRFLSDRVPRASCTTRCLRGLMGAFKYDRTYFDKIVSSVGPLMEKLTTGKIAELDLTRLHRCRGSAPHLRPALGDPQPFGRVCRSGRAVGYHRPARSATRCSPTSSRSPVISTSTARPAACRNWTRTPQKLRICLHADEFNELIGDEVHPDDQQGGRRRLQVTAYTQTWATSRRVSAQARPDRSPATSTP